MIKNFPVIYKTNCFWSGVSLLIGFLFLPSISLWSQEPTAINYTTENGLLSNEVYDLFEDKDGFLWIGTNKGAIRFNSDAMQPYTQNSGLADRDVLSIHQDSKGKVWFLSYNGKLSYWNEGKVYSEENDGILKEIQSASYFSSFLEDQAGNIWFGTYASGVFRIDTLNEVKHFKKVDPPFENTTLPDPHIFPALFLFENASGQICLSNPSAAYVFDNDQFNQIEPFEYRQRRGKFQYSEKGLFSASYNRICLLNIYNGKVLWEKLLPAVTEINAVELLSDGYLYAATNNGVYSFDQDGNAKESFLTGEKVSDVLIDREGNLWVSTLTSGIFLIKNSNVLNYSTKAKYCILKRKDAILFGGLGTEIHGLSEGYLHFLPISHEEGRNSFYVDRVSSDQDKVISLVEDVQGEIWFATYNGLYHLEGNKAKHCLSGGVKSLFYANENLYASLPNKRVIGLDRMAMESIHEEFNKGEKKRDENRIQLMRKYTVFSKQINSLTETKHHGIIAGTNDKMVRYEDSLFHELNDYPRGKIIGIEEEIIGNLWLLEKNKGLYYYKLSNNELDSIQLFGKEKKVMYTSLFLEKDGSVWIGTDQGLVNVNVTGNSFSAKYINKKNGLSSEEINDLSLHNDTLWLATAKGISLLPKQSLKDTIAPLLSIDSILMNERFVDDSSRTHLILGSDALTIHYTGISYRDEGELSYKYQLNGKKKLSGSSFDRHLILQDLPPSKYSLLISCIDSAGNRSVQRKVEFTIRLQWWQNWKYWLILVLVFLLIFGMSFRLLLKRNLQKMYTVISKQVALLEREKYITVRSVLKGTNMKILLKDLHYVKASGDYTEFFKKKEKILVRASMKSIEGKLIDEQAFVRVHKSYIVNLKKVKGFKSDALEILGQSIPISRRKRDEVKERISSFL